MIAVEILESGRPFRTADRYCDRSFGIFLDNGLPSSNGEGRFRIKLTSHEIRRASFIHSGTLGRGGCGHFPLAPSRFASGREPPANGRAPTHQPHQPFCARKENRRRRCHANIVYRCPGLGSVIVASFVSPAGSQYGFGISIPGPRGTARARLVSFSQADPRKSRCRKDCPRLKAGSFFREPRSALDVAECRVGACV